MPLYTTESGLLFGIGGILIMFFIICSYGANYLELQMITRWKGELASMMYLSPIKKKLANPLLGLLLDGILAAISMATLGFIGGIAVTIIAFILDKSVLSKFLLKEKLQKALVKNTYDTKINGDGGIRDKIAAANRIQLKFLIEHPGTAVLVATMRIEIASKYQDSMYMPNISDIKALDEKLFAFFMQYPYSEEGKKLIEKEIEDVKEKNSVKLHSKKESIIEKEDDNFDECF